MDRVDIPTIYNTYNMTKEKKKMAENVMFNVKGTFDMEAFTNKLADTYKAKGYTVNILNMNGVCSITFEKATGGINTLLGMGEGIKANITRTNDTVSINFSDAEWMGKIIGFAIGWFLCLIPLITAAIGTMRQLSLPKGIANDATMIAASL